MNDDEPIGEGATTLDYLKARHPWLKEMLAEMQVKIDTLLAENESLRANLDLSQEPEVVASCELNLLRVERDKLATQVTGLELIARQAVLVGYAYRDDGHDKEWLTRELASLHRRIEAVATTSVIAKNVELEGRIAELEAALRPHQ